MKNSQNQGHSLISSDIQPLSLQPPPKQCGLALKPGISSWNFFSLLLISLASVMSLLTGTSLLSVLIQDKEYYDIPQDHLGDIYGSFGTYVECFALISELTSGYLQDIFGRKVIVVVSLFLQCITSAILPFGGSLYPGLFLIRIVQATSVAWCLTTPLLPDYVTDQSKGKAGGYYQLAANLGSLLFSFGLLQIAEHFDMLFACQAQAFILFLIAVYCSCFVKNMHKSQQHQLTIIGEEGGSPEMNEPSRSCCGQLGETIKFIFAYIRKEKCLILMLVSGFVGRVHDLTFSSTISLWVSKYLYSTTSQTSHHLTISLGGGNAFSLVTSFLLGWLFDRYGEKPLLPLVQLLAGLPYLLLYFASPLNSPYAYFLQIWGTTMGIQINNISYIMLAKYAPPKDKGAIYGLYFFICGLAVLGYSYLGGWMVDQSFNKSVFLLVACLSFAVIVVHFGFLIWGSRYFKK